MDPRDFQKLAAKLASGKSPSEIRTAISRAYYSVFNVGVELLKGIGSGVSEGPGGHGEVEHRLSNSANINVEKVGSQLSDLRSRRIRADYRLDKKEIENQKNAQALVQQAHKMIQTLDTCFTGPHREEIISAIREYLQKFAARR